MWSFDGIFRIIRCGFNWFIFDFNTFDFGCCLRNGFINLWCRGCWCCWWFCEEWSNRRFSLWRFRCFCRLALFWAALCWALFLFFDCHILWVASWIFSGLNIFWLWLWLNGTKQIRWLFHWCWLLLYWFFSRRYNNLVHLDISLVTFYLQSDTIRRKLVNKSRKMLIHLVYSQFTCCRLLNIQTLAINTAHFDAIQ